MARRNRRTRTVTRNRRRRNAVKKVSKGIKSQWRKISTGAGVIAGLAQITGTDMAASTGQPIAIRAKNFSNSLLGRVTGFTPFKDAPGANTPQTISFRKACFNKIYRNWSWNVSIFNDSSETTSTQE